MARWILGTILTAAAAVSAPAADVPHIQIGMYQTMFRDITPGMVQAVAKPLKKVIEKTMKLTGDAELVPDAATLAAGISDGKIQIGVFHGYEFAWLMAKHPDLEPFMLAVPHGKLRASIIVRANNPAEKLADLKNQTVAIHKAIKAHCVLYLDDQRKGLDETTATVIEKPDVTMEEMLQEVASGAQAAAVVDAALLEAMINISPGIAKGIKVIDTSETFPYAVLAIRKDGIDPEVRKRVMEGLANAHNTPQGKPLMMLWSLKAFELPPDDYHEELVTVLKNYPARTPKVVTGTLTGREKTGNE